jgi:hypothetical protein
MLSKFQNEFNSYRNPAALHYIRDGQPQGRRFLKHARYESLGLVRHDGPLGLGKYKLSGSNAEFHPGRHRVQFVYAEKGRIPAAQDVHDHSQRPDVTRYIVKLRAEYLRRHVIGRKTRQVRIDYKAAVTILQKKWRE